MNFHAMRSSLSAPIRQSLDRAAIDFLHGSGARIDFTAPAGEAALVSPDSISWRIFKNPVALFIGGVTAVILELAEPRVRTGVWEHTNFKTDPVARLKRTGLAAMVTVYGPRSIAEPMIARINRIHERIEGETPAGVAYRASDPELLNWVQATAAFGFLQAYSTYAASLPQVDRDRYFSEGGAAARLYGANGSPANEAEWRALYQQMFRKFEPSDIVHEFLSIMRAAPALPPMARPMQRMLVRAAVDLVPADARERLGLGRAFGLRPFEGMMVRRMARRADRWVLPSSPAAQASVRMGRPADWLYRRR